MSDEYLFFRDIKTDQRLIPSSVDKQQLLSQSPQFGEEESAVITSSTLFVGDLSITCTENDLIELFSKIIDREHIASVHILRCRTTGTSLCYGFVTITSPTSETDANIARNELHGMYLFGRYLKIRSAKADCPTVPEPVSEFKSTKNLYNYDLPKISIYVKFQANHISNNDCINEENIRQIFDLSDEAKKIICDAVDDDTSETITSQKQDLTSASIIDVSIKKLAVDKHTHCQFGYGFIFYHDNQQGLSAALHTLNEKGNIQIYTNNLDASKTIDRHPISYTLQSSKGLESYLTYIKGSSENTGTAPKIIKPSTPVATVVKPPQEQGTVFVRNADYGGSASGYAPSVAPRAAVRSQPPRRRQPPGGYGGYPMHPRRDGWSYSPQAPLPHNGGRYGAPGYHYADSEYSYNVMRDKGMPPPPQLDPRCVGVQTHGAYHTHSRDAMNTQHAGYSVAPNDFQPRANHSTDPIGNAYYDSAELPVNYDFFVNNPRGCFL